tara:strand:- start:2072 stop:3265 length:1194 start_codon:yes stop_codon:yes gene_type:complete
MAKRLQLRGGTTSQHASFTGAVREVTVDTDKDILVVHDGSTAGGFPAHRDLKGSDIASADPLVIVAGSNYFIVTGTTGFNDMTVAANTHFFLEFAGALVMTHVGGTLDLPSGAAITTAAGDVGEFFATAANVVTCVNYTKASGKPVKTDFVNADINASAAIAQSKLADIVNADVDASAAIATSKISGAVTSIASHGLGSLATLSSVDTAQLAADAVDGTKIEDDAINSEHYAAGSIDLEHMSSESVDEDNLHISNAGSNGQFLSKQSGNTGGLTWAAAGDASLDTAQTFTKGQRGEITALSDGSTITPDFADSNNFSVTLGGNRTLANPSNLTAGQSGSIFVTQDGSGSRTLAYGSYWDWVGGTAPTLTTTASKIDRIDYVVRTTGSIHAVASLDLS